MPDEFSAAEAQAETERLRAKQSAIDDEDIRLALQARIDTLESEIAKAKKPVAEVASTEDVLEATASPEQIKEADNFIRQAKVEKMRGNAARATSLMKDAAAVAPNAPSVLEALGDDLAERKQYKAAQDAYSQAMKYSKNNLALERKHATMSLRSTRMGTVDDMLRGGYSDSLLVSSEESYASIGTARMLSAFFPGAGHIVLGKSVTGITLLVIWALCVGWTAFMNKDVAALTRMIVGKNAHPNLLVMVPLFGAVVTYLAGLATLGGGGGGGRKNAVSRPAPPVDLPFE